MPDAPPFVSVKLPSALVDQARDAAHTMRRSVASQIEYWATLGKALEYAGLTTGDSQALIARQERARYVVDTPPALRATVRPSGQPAALPDATSELEALHNHVLEVARSGALVEHTREPVKANRRKGEKPGKPREAA